MAIHAADSQPDLSHRDLMRTARITGLLYLGFFVAGILGSLVVRAQLFSANDPEQTLSNLTEHESLARVGIALELGIVLAQALTAVSFYRLFRNIDTFAAGCLAAFGMINAVAIMGSAAILATALEAADDASLAVTGGSAATVQILYVASDHLWKVAAMFFGLWLIPMGWLVVRSLWLPRAMGWILIIGGVGYLLSPFVSYLVPDVDAIAELLTVPSILGEVWIMGHLVIIGARAAIPDSESPGA